jgi:hypothetical protein
MNVNEPIVIQITLAIQTCVNNYNTERHENPTNSGVSDNRSQTEGQTDVAST